MKNLLLFVLCTFGLTAFAQKVRFTDTSNRWLVRYRDSDWSTFQFNKYTGDTTINGISYRRMYTSWNDYESYNAGPYTYLREDTSVAKIYVLIKDTEQVFMDYNFQVGDTLTIKNRTGYTSSSFVQSIDSTLINTVYHKVWHFKVYQYGWQFSVIEGIGCTAGPLFQIEPTQGLMSFALMCFDNRSTNPLVAPAVDNHLDFSFDNSISCTLGVNALAKPTSVLSFNNPVYDNLYVTSSVALHHISIQDMLGRIVYTGNFNSEKANVNIADFPPGLYFLRINNTPPKKFIKQ